METNVKVELLNISKGTAQILVSENNVVVKSIMATSKIESAFDDFDFLSHWPEITLKDDTEEYFRRQESFEKLFPSPHKKRDPMTDD